MAKLRANLETTAVYVEDQSGGCGAQCVFPFLSRFPTVSLPYPIRHILVFLTHFVHPLRGPRYMVEVESPKFKGMSIVAQHRLVNSILKDEIANMHAVRIFTKSSE